MFMENLEFHTGEFDACLYHRREMNRNTIYMLLYVDEILLASKDIDDVLHIKSLFK